MVRSPQRSEPEWILDDWFICHRGVEPSVIAEIVAALTEKGQDMAVQEDDGLSRSLPELRALVQQQAGSRRIIVLLNGHLPGPVYRQTFAPVKNATIDCVRVEDCDVDGVHFLSVDLADITDVAERKQQICRIVRDRSKAECR